MWHKNLQIYRMAANCGLTATQLSAQLAKFAFVPCTGMDLQSQGFVAPRDGGELVHAVNGQLLITLRTEKKLLPASVINQVTKAKAAELEEQQGFKPGRKQMKDLKEQVTDELLPRAFAVQSNTAVWIDPINGWLVVDTAAPAKADDVIKLLLRSSVDRFPVTSLRVMQSPVAAMTSWLSHDEAPAGFTIDQDTELRSCGLEKSAVRYVSHTLDHDDMGRHIAAGKQCTRLALTWNDKISFVLTESLAIKRVTALDVIKENADRKIGNEAERFDSDFALMTGELNRMLGDLVAALGGEATNEVIDSGINQAAAALHALNKRIAGDDGVKMLDVAEPHTGTGPDPLYDEAVKIVQLQRRASISLVQRHLRIGYNRAARLMEEMEVKGVVSKMETNGNRNVLVEAA